MSSYEFFKFTKENKITLLMGIVAKKWEPRNPVPSRFSGQIRKVEARSGKKVLT